MSTLPAASRARNLGGSRRATLHRRQRPLLFSVLRSVGSLRVGDLERAKMKGALMECSSEMQIVSRDPKLSVHSWSVAPHLALPSVACAGSLDGRFLMLEW